MHKFVVLYSFHRAQKEHRLQGSRSRRSDLWLKSLAPGSRTAALLLFPSSLLTLPVRRGAERVREARGGGRVVLLFGGSPWPASGRAALLEPPAAAAAAAAAARCAGSCAGTSLVPGAGRRAAPHASRRQSNRNYEH